MLEAKTCRSLNKLRTRYQTVGPPLGDASQWLHPRARLDMQESAAWFIGSGIELMGLWVHGEQSRHATAYWKGSWHQHQPLTLCMG